MDEPASHPRQEDFPRIATRCVCCGEDRLDRAPAVLMPFVAHRVFGWEPVVIDATWGLETIATGHAYSICNSLHCRACGHLFLDVRFDDDELRRLYDDYRGPEYTALRERYEPGYGERNRTLCGGVPYVGAIEQFLRPLLPSPPRVLDWGGDTGRNTPFRGDCARHLVYDISRVTPVPGARAVSREEAASLEHDLVTCCMVLEHVPFPARVLREIRQVLGAHTVLYVEVPFEQVMRAGHEAPHRHKRHWHEHVNFFSRRSLAEVVLRCGLSVQAEAVHHTMFEGREIAVLQLACRAVPEWDARS